MGVRLVTLSTYRRYTNNCIYLSIYLSIYLHNDIFLADIIGYDQLKFS